MGFNTTVVVMNDALNYIAEDKDFGKNLELGILDHYWDKDRVDVPARTASGRGVHGNAAVVVAQHHADCTSIIAVGGNCATVLGKYWGTHHKPEDKLRLLKLMADELGYCVRKKPK